MTTSLFVFGLLGIVTTALAFYANRRFFASGEFARVSVLEGVFYVVGVVSLCLGWYFNVRYTHSYAHSSYVNYTKALFSNWASDSAAQDYTVVNVCSCHCGPSPTDVGGESLPLDLLRDEPLYEPGLLDGLLPGLRRATDPLRPGGGGGINTSYPQL